MRRFPFAFENLGPTVRPVQISRELNALANNLNPDPDRPRPKGIGVCEAIGKDLPPLSRYSLIRDRSRPSRANIALYVRSDLPVFDVDWLDLTNTWPRTEHPGMHPPRSILVANVNHWRVIIGHAPPNVPRSTRARNEWLDAMVTLMARGSSPVIALTDPNGLGAELRFVAGGVTDGTAVEAVHARGVFLDRVDVPRTVNGVPMMTDHRRALLGRATRRYEENSP